MIWTPKIPTQCPSYYAYKNEIQKRFLQDFAFTYFSSNDDYKNKQVYIESQEPANFLNLFS